MCFTTSETSSVGIAGGMGVEPPVHVYRLLFWGENLFYISIPVPNFKHFDI